MALKDFLEEAAIMKDLKHPNLVQLLGVCTREAPLYMIMEFMSNGNLLDFLRGSHPDDLPPTTLLYMAQQIAAIPKLLHLGADIFRFRPVKLHVSRVEEPWLPGQ